MTAFRVVLLLLPPSDAMYQTQRKLRNNTAVAPKLFIESASASHHDISLYFGDHTTQSLGQYFTSSDILTRSALYSVVLHRKKTKIPSRGK
eukprot:3718283-Amphidinium_carterae.1